MAPRATSRPRPRVTASATLPAVTTAPAQAVSSGMRTAPASQTWRSHSAPSAAVQRERVNTSRFLQDEVAIIGYIIKGLAEEAIGDGLSATSNSSNAAFKKEASAYFAQWADSPAIDTRKRLDFYRAQRLLAETMMGDGEIFALKVKDTSSTALARPLSDASFRRLQVQFLLRDQIGNGGNRPYLANGTDFIWDQGIKYNYLDQEVEYRVLKGISTVNGDTNYVSRSSSEMLHIFDDRTFNQHHGDPWLFRGHKSGLDAMDLHAVRKFAAKIQSMFLGAIQTKDGQVPKSMQGLMRKGTATSEDGQTTTDNGLRYLELGGGVVIPLFAEGQTMSFFQGREAISFPELMKEMWSEICLSLGAPPEYIINIAGLGSASVRMVIGKIKRLLNRIRRPIRDQFCQPMWEFVIGDAIEQGLAWTRDESGNIVQDWKSVDWLGGGIDPSIDAGRDEKAEQNKLVTYTGTREAYCAAYGLNGDAVGRARIDEILADVAYGSGLSVDEVRKQLPLHAWLPMPQVQALSGIQLPTEPPPEPVPTNV